MAASSSALAFYNTSNATFQAWVQAVEAAIVTLSGWVVTSDTGQINTSTVAAPASNTLAGYRIYAMNDALQASSPFYMKVEYGTMTVGAGTLYGRVRFSVGTGTNGAGTLTGNTSTTYDSTASSLSSTDTTSYISYFSGDTNRFACYLNDKATEPVRAYVFSVSRLRDLTGAITGDGVYIYHAIGTASVNSKQQVVGKIGGGIGTPAAVSNVWTAAYPALSNGSANGTDAFGIFPALPIAGRPYGPHLDIGIVGSTDLPAASTLRYSAFGQTITWLRTTCVTFSTAYVTMVRFD